MKIALAIVLAVAATVGAFSPPATLPRTRSYDRRLSTVFSVQTKTVWQELTDLDAEVEEEGLDDDAPMTAEQLNRLIGILETIVNIEQRATDAFSLFQGFLSGESTLEAEQSVSRKSTTTDNAFSSIDVAKAFSVMDPIMSPKNMGGSGAYRYKSAPSKDSDSIFVVALRILNMLKRMDTPGDMQYGRYPDHAEYPHVSLADLPRLKAAVMDPPPSEYNFSTRKFIRALKRLLRITAGVAIAQTRIDAASTWEEKFDAVFSPKRIMGFIPNPLNLVPRPARLIKKWDQDTEFARQFFNGVNPIMIKVCKDPNKELTPELLKFFEEHDIDVVKLAGQSRLLYADYSGLADLEKNPHNSYPKEYNPHKEHDPRFDRYFHAPVVVFELARNKVDIDVLAIELDTNKGTTREVFSHVTTPKNEWLMAKTCVAAADSQYHEWVSHLCATHMTFEPHIIALHNTLRKRDHPLWDFFEPLTKDTLFLNWSARFTLAEFGMNSFGDVVTSVGVGQYMQLIKKHWESYDFFRSSALPDELEARGFDADAEFPGYYYREDGMELWNAMGDFITDFVNEVYSSDEELANDEVVKDWAFETTAPDRGAINGFPKQFDDRATLVRTMQTMWWICSGLHAAVNFPQYDYYAFTPNKPLGLNAGMDQFRAADGENNPDWIYESAMGDEGFWVPRLGNLVTAHALTVPSEKCIDNLSTHYDKTRYGKKSYEKFLAVLDGIGDKIEARNKRNKKIGKLVYSYLHPSNVPASIDI